MASDPIRLLLVEDDPTDAEYTRAMLAQVRVATVEVRWVTTVAEGLDALRDDAHDVALVDYLVGSENGLDLVREASRLELPTPLILLTGRGSRDVDLEAQEAGAADYLVKGRIDPRTLDRVLRYTLDRSRDRRALVESEARLRSLFDHLPLGLFRCTPDGGFLDANPALVSLLGQPTPELLRERYAASFYVHSADLARMRRRLREEGLVRGFESWLERSDGFHVPVRVTARAHRDTRGRLEYVEGAVEDLRSPGEGHRLQLGSSRFRAVFEELSLAMALTDADGEILDVTPALAAGVGADPSELVARPLADVLTDAAAEAWRGARTALSDGAAPSVVIPDPVVDAPWRRATCIPVRDHDGETVEFVVRFTGVEGP